MTTPLFLMAQVMEADPELSDWILLSPTPVETIPRTLSPALSMLARLSKVLKEDSEEEWEVPDSPAQQNAVSRRAQANWKRWGIRVFQEMRTFKQAQTDKYIADHLSKKYHQEDQPGPKAKAKAKTRPKKESLPSGFGSPLARSKGGPYEMEPENCQHPYQKLIRKGAGPKKDGTNYAGWLCTDCGSRWERIETPKDEIPPNTTPESAAPQALNFDSPPVCPSCKTTMLAKRIGWVWGCRMYPDCCQTFQSDMTAEKQKEMTRLAKDRASSSRMSENPMAKAQRPTVFNMQTPRETSQPTVEDPAPWMHE